ncbi:MAG: hypothetical protein ACM3YO_08260 [Bacteroidota bacterium]
MFRKLTEKISETIAEKSERMAETLIEKTGQTKAGNLVGKAGQKIAETLSELSETESFEKLEKLEKFAEALVEKSGVDRIDALRKWIPQAEENEEEVEEVEVLPTDRESLEALHLEQPEHLGVRLELARALLREEEFDLALEHLEALKTVASEWSEIYAAHAELLTRQGLIEPAIEQWIEALELDGGRAEWHFRIALLFRKANDHGQAIRALTTATSLEARAPWLSKLGDWLLAAGERRLALEAYEDSLLSAPDREVRGKALALQALVGDPESAEAHRKALQEAEE